MSYEVSIDDIVCNFEKSALIHYIVNVYNLNTHSININNDGDFIIKHNENENINLLSNKEHIYGKDLKFNFKNKNKKELIIQFQ